jgi:positive regulator of sigma E activity
MSSKAALLVGTVILIAVVLAVVRFLVHELVRFVEISAILVVIILVLAWLVARKSGRPAASKP